MCVRNWQKVGFRTWRCDFEGQGWVEICPASTGFFYVKWVFHGRIHFENHRLHPWHEKDIPFFPLRKAVQRARMVMKLEFRVKGKQNAERNSEIHRHLQQEILETVPGSTTLAVHTAEPSGGMGQL